MDAFGMGSSSEYSDYQVRQIRELLVLSRHESLVH